MIQVAYTNSNCIDIWEVFKQQMFKHSPYPLYFISDRLSHSDGLKAISYYDNNEPYYQVWTRALKSFGSDYFIYLQEDFILYSNVDTNKLEEYLKFLKENPDFSFVRLIKSGSLGSKQISNNLFEVESTNKDAFSMQATIWRTSDYIKLMEEVKDSKWLENDNYRNAMIKLNMKGVYHYNNEPKRGLNHYDSNVYPYIATGLVRGKWNISEYKDEFLPILKEYNINTKLRGEY